MCLHKISPREFIAEFSLFPLYVYNVGTLGGSLLIPKYDSMTSVEDFITMLGITYQIFKPWR